MVPDLDLTGRADVSRAGVDPLEALDVVAGHMRTIVTGPTVRDDMCSSLTARLDPP